MDEEKLIEIVKTYENLYNPANKYYRNQNLKKEAWDEVGAKLGISGNECKDIWTKLRNSFTNARKRRLAMQGHEATKNLIKWKFEDQMSFLVPTIQTRQRRIHSTTVHSEEEDKYCDEIDPIEVKEYSEEISISPGPSTSNLPAFESVPVITDIKQEANVQKRSIEHTVEDILGVMKENKRIRTEVLAKIDTENPVEVNYAKDETEMFFLSLGRSVKNLSPIELTTVKMEISNIVFQAELRDLQRQQDN